MTAITKELAQRVDEVVRAGLVAGLGEPVPGQMCVEAAVCYALGEPHSDRPSCVGSAVRAYKIRLNDARWGSKDARAAGMRALAIAQLGSDALDQAEFAKRIALATVREVLPPLLKARGFVAHAKRCASAETLQEAKAAAAAAYAAGAAAAYAAGAADAAAAAYATYAEAYAASASAAAAAAADAAADGVDADATLSSVARMCTRILVEMGSPGAQWLGIVEDA